MPSVAKKLVIVQNNERRRTRRRRREPRGRKNCGCSKRCCLPPASRSTRRRWRAGCPTASTSKQALAQLKAEYATRGVNLVRIGKKWTFRTADDLSWLLTKQTIETRKLSRAAIETLAIIAYHQPVTRAEIEEIRGVVTAAGTLDVLLRDRLDPPARPPQGAGPADHLRHHGSVPVAFRAGGGGRSARPRRAQRRRAAGRQSAAGFAVPMPSDDADAARRRGPAGAGRSRFRPGAAARARREVRSIGSP